MTQQLKTDTQIQKAIKQTIKLGKEKTYTFVGYEGLRLRVRPKKNQQANATFVHKYTHLYINQKQVTIKLGTYPAFSLEQARTAHRDNMALLAQGIDPQSHHEAERIAKQKAITNTFQTVADDWLAHQLSDSKNLPAKRTQENWNDYLQVLNAEFAKQPMETITTAQMLALCRRVQAKSVHKGNRVKGLAKRIFAHAVVNGIISHNVVAELDGAKALKPMKSKHHPALTKPQEFACLLKEVEQLDTTLQPFNKPILQLLALTFVRIGDICAMKWADIDWNAKQWLLKPQKSKGRNDMVEKLVIPLAPQTISILQNLKEVTGAYEYVFYNHRRKKAPYHDQQSINKQLNHESMNKDHIGEQYSIGYKDVHSPHGFRATAKTLLMERLGYDELITEMQLGHKMLNKYGNAYNRMEAIEQRTKMMTEWADYLDELKAGKYGTTIFVDFKDKEQAGAKLG